MPPMQMRFARFLCLALDHRPHVADDLRSGTRFLVCRRCNRFLGFASAGADGTAEVPRGLAAAQHFAAEAKIESAR